MNINEFIRESISSSNEYTSRILQSDGVRLSVKLENIYWDYLKKEAVNNNTSLSKFVHQILQLTDGITNKTAYLRNFCFLNESISKITGANESGINNISEFITACPVPIIILAKERKIIAHNSLFTEEFISPNKAAAGQTSLGPPRLTFSQPFNKVYDFMLGHPGKIVSGQIGLIIGEKSYQRQVRYVLADRRQGQDSHVLLFIRDK